MHRKFHELMTNTTSLVGYIAILMFAGAYMGGNQGVALDPTFFKGSVLENGIMTKNTQSLTRSVIITVDGRQYRAEIGEEVSERPVFQY